MTVCGDPYCPACNPRFHEDETIPPKRPALTPKQVREATEDWRRSHEQEGEDGE